VFAFLSAPSAGEMMILLIVGVLLFGRDLPDVGRKLGRTLAQFRRGLQDFKDQLDRDSTIRELRDTVHDTVRDVKQAAAVPRQLADPATALRDLATDAMRAPIPSTGDPPAADPPAASQPAAGQPAAGEPAAGQPAAAQPAAAQPPATGEAADAPHAAPADPAADGRSD
jgi:TatA/E family protein of Tat protein translocase